VPRVRLRLNTGCRWLSVLAGLYQPYFVARFSDGGVRVVVICREYRLGLFNTRQVPAVELVPWFIRGSLDVFVVCCDGLFLLTSSAKEPPSSLIVKYRHYTQNPYSQGQ
jgi:hypothetical protein